MKDETNSLITRAEEYMNKREFADAGRCYEMAAAAVDDKREVVEFLKKAAQAYDKTGATEDAVRCYLEASQFLGNLGYENGTSSLQYFIKIADPQESECEVPFGPWDDVLDIQVFTNRGQKSLEDWVPSSIPVFMLPPMIIDGHRALRFLEGGGAPGKGEPLYNVLFQKDDFIFALFTPVDCTAIDGSCEPPRDENFIVEIDEIAKTLRFVR